MAKLLGNEKKPMFDMSIENSPEINAKTSLYKNKSTLPTMYSKRPKKVVKILEQNYSPVDMERDTMIRRKTLVDIEMDADSDFEQVDE